MFLIVAAVGVLATSGSSDDNPATASTQSALSPQLPSGSTGAAIACPGGGQTDTYFSQVGGEFRIVGRLASIDTNANQMLVKGPERYVKLNLANDAKIDGTLTGGQVIKASGNFDPNGDTQTTEVAPACSAPVAVVNVTAAPTPAPTQLPTAVPTAIATTQAPVQIVRLVAAAPAVKPAPAGGAVPIARPTRTPNDNGGAQPASDDDGDDDNDAGHGHPKKDKNEDTHGDD